MFVIVERDPLKRDFTRVVVWYSCGITSAVSAMMTIKKYQGLLPVEIVYTDPGGEHPDNKRFIKDCEEWFGQKIIILKSEKYKDIWDCFEKSKYLAGVWGATCTSAMKKSLRFKYEDLASDIQVFGFDDSEEKRAERFRQNNPEVYLETPLIDSRLTKNDCLAIVSRQGIKLPAMYLLGYKNNNCIGCVKGGSGYWNKIRIDFPDVFERMSNLEQKLNVALNKSYAGDGKRKRVFLKDLPKDAGIYKSEHSIECGILCYATEDEIS